MNVLLYSFSFHSQMIIPIKLHVLLILFVLLLYIRALVESCESNYVNTILSLECKETVFYFEYQYVCYKILLENSYT